MAQILRLYPIIDGKETCVREPKEIARLLANPSKEIDLDYERAGRVKMGSSRDFIGETVKVGDDIQIQIPEH